MASETNELTFVRCPTCRSLVPASASRCRICNATLDAGSKVAGTEAPPSSGGRVRQKTVVAGPEEIKGLVSGNVAAAPTAPTQSPPMSPPPVSAAPVKDSGAAATAQTDDDDVFDPLGAFLQDLDSPVGSEEKSNTPQPKKVDDATVSLFDDDDDEGENEDDDLDDLDLDDFDDPLLDDPLLDELDDDAPVETEGSPVETQSIPQDEEEAEPDPRKAEAFLDDPVEDEIPVEPQKEVSKPSPAAPRREAPQRDVPRPPETKKPQNRDPQLPAERAAKPSHSAPASRVSSGHPRPRIGGLPQRASTPAAAPRVAPPNERQTPASPRVAESRDTLGRTETAVPQVPPRSTPHQKSLVDSQPSPQAAIPPVRTKPDVAAPRSQSRQVPERSQEVAESAGARLGKTKQGRLFGWLVSYENPDGRAIELRAGRFFVTGTSIRPTDLILEDQSISTPHALMAITETGFQVQDLMSERGTFVRCQGEAQYTREDGVVEIRHGDWIRFGDVEFLVTIVPS